MVNISNATYWVASNLAYGNDSVMLPVLYASYSGVEEHPVTQATFGKIIKKCFPDAKLGTKSSKDPPSPKRIRVYNGITWPDLKSDPVPVETILAEEGFVISKREGGIDATYHQPGISFKIFACSKTISIVETGEYWISVDGLKQDTANLGLPIALPTTPHGIHNLARLLKGISFCFGLATAVTGRKVLADEYRNLEEEITSPLGRAEDCSRMVTLLALNSICNSCKKKDYNIEKHEKRTLKMEQERGATCQESLNPEQVQDETNLEGEAIEGNAPTCEEERPPPKNKTSGLMTKLGQILDDLEITSPMKLFLTEQVKNSLCHPQARRWDRDVLVTFLQLYSRAPTAYGNLAESGMLIMPSPRLLQEKKNAVHQTPGFNDENFQWMEASARNNKVPDHGRRGGLVFDEMTVQSDLQLDTRGNVQKWHGLVTLGEEADALETIVNKASKPKLATHILQLLFHGYTDFVFPVAFFTTCGVKAYQLLSIITDAVVKLRGYGFHVEYLMYDGAAANRSFLKHIVGPDPISKSMTCSLGDVGKKIINFVDPKHVIKRLRNMVLMSGGDADHSRFLVVDGHPVIWSHWEQAYHWDRSSNAEMMRLHHRLTDDHIKPTESGKMRNQLAEHVLDRDMLFLMQSYAATLDQPSDLNGSIKFLQNTSFIVSLFNSTTALSSHSDDRLTKLPEVFDFFKCWVSEDRKSTMTTETTEDTIFLLSAFCGLAEMLLGRNQSFHPSSINSDIVENFFCKQRCLFNGSNSNPTTLQYSKTINSILLGATSRRSLKRSNCPGTLPYNKKQLN